MSESISRRPFIKTTIAAGIATTMVKAQDAAPKKKKLGWALVGLGGLSKNWFAPALQKTENAYLAAVVTGSPDKAKDWCKKYNLDEEKDVFSYDDFDKIADHKGVDVVCIVLPNHLHHDFTLRSVKAGKHVYCEKPMAITSKECREMIAACDKAKLKLGIAYRNRFDPHHMEAIRFGKEKVFGELRHIDAGFAFRMGGNNWRMKKEFGGGPLLDVGVYAIQAARYLTGEEPHIVSAVETKTDPKKFSEVEETVQFMLQYPSGKTANLMTSFNVNGYNQFTVFADKGRYGMKNAFGYRGQNGWTSNKDIKLSFAATDHFKVQVDLFSQSIQNNTPWEVDGVDGLRDILICEAVNKSIAEGKPVAVEKV